LNLQINSQDDDKGSCKEAKATTYYSLNKLLITANITPCSTDDDSSFTGIIIGVVVVIVVLALIIICVVLWWISMRKKRKKVS
jgi:hypothetical protein